MKRCRGIILAGVLALSLTAPVRADRSVKTELPQDTTDYYMTVDSGGIGVDIYPGTSSKDEKLNGAAVKDGTVLHIEGETEKNGETWGYTEYNGTHGYVPLDELRPSKDAELAAAGVTGNNTGNAAQNSDNAAETRVGNPGLSNTDSTVQNPDDRSADIRDSNTETDGEKNTDIAGKDNNTTADIKNPTSDDNSGKSVNTGESDNTNMETTSTSGSESGSTETAESESAPSSDAFSTDRSEETDAKHVNGTAAKSFKEDSSWYQNPFIWIGIVTVLATAGILGYHLKKS